MFPVSAMVGGGCGNLTMKVGDDGGGSAFMEILAHGSSDFWRHRLSHRHDENDPIEGVLGAMLQEEVVVL